MAYGGLQDVSRCDNFPLFMLISLGKTSFTFSLWKRVPLQFLNERNPDYTSVLVQNRVLPLYSLCSCSPYLMATANWVLGALASCLPEVIQCILKNSRST